MDGRPSVKTGAGAVNIEERLGVTTRTLSLVPPMTSGCIRQPSLRGDTLVFCSEDDLWVASCEASSAPAARLTAAAAHGAACSHPAISPDGEWVAFASTLGGDGAWDVWMVPLSGGAAVRLTYEGVAPAEGSRCSLSVCGWSTDGAAVLYASPSFSGLADPQLVLVTAFGAQRGECTLLPLSSASEGVLVRRPSEPADTLFFVRLPFHGSVCQGYRGGLVQQIWRWRVDGGAGEALLLTGDYPGPSRCPMWAVALGRLLFLSDRSGFVELWSCTADGDELRRHTALGARGLDAYAACLDGDAHDGARVVIEASLRLHMLTLTSPSQLAAGGGGGGRGSTAAAMAAGATSQVAGQAGGTASAAAAADADAERAQSHVTSLTTLPLRLRSAREATQPRMLARPLDHLQHMAIHPSGDRAVRAPRDASNPSASRSLGAVCLSAVVGAVVSAVVSAAVAERLSRNASGAPSPSWSPLPFRIPL